MHLNSITLPFIPVLVVFCSAILCASRNVKETYAKYHLWNPQTFFVTAFILTFFIMILTTSCDLVPHSHVSTIHYDPYLLHYHKVSGWFDFLTNNALFVELLTSFIVLAESHIETSMSCLDVHVFVTVSLLHCSMLSTFVVSTLSQFAFTPVVSSLVQVPLCVQHEFVALICNAIVHTMPFLVFNSVMYFRLWNRNSHTELPGRRIDLLDVAISSLSFLWVIFMYYLEDLWKCAYNLLNTEYERHLFYNGEVFFTAFAIALIWPIILFAVH